MEPRPTTDVLDEWIHRAAGALRVSEHPDRTMNQEIASLVAIYDALFPADD
jgi:hypothetical protein